MLREKSSKRGNLIASQNSGNGVPVQAGVLLSAIREGNFWTSELCRFGGTFGDLGGILEHFGCTSFFKTLFANDCTLIFSILDRFWNHFEPILELKIEKRGPKSIPKNNHVFDVVFLELWMIYQGSHSRAINFVQN